MVPFSSSMAYSWHMNKRPIDPFATYIWSNAPTPRCKHFLWLPHRVRLPSAALLHRRNIVDHDQPKSHPAPMPQSKESLAIAQLAAMLVILPRSLGSGRRPC
nr:unnamed protein product [Digitaria exilis]